MESEVMGSIDNGNRVLRTEKVRFSDKMVQM